MISDIIIVIFLIILEEKVVKPKLGLHLSCYEGLMLRECGVLVN